MWCRFKSVKRCPRSSACLTMSWSNYEWFEWLMWWVLDWTGTQFLLRLIRTSGFVLGRRAEERKYTRSYCERYFSSFGTTVTLIFVCYNKYILSVSRILELRKCEKLVLCLPSSLIVMPKNCFKLCAPDVLYIHELFYEKPVSCELICFRFS